MEGKAASRTVQRKWMGVLTRDPTSGQKPEGSWAFSFSQQIAERVGSSFSQNHCGKVVRAEREPIQQGTYSSPARYLSSACRRDTGVTQAGSTQRPQVPVHLARPSTHHLGCRQCCPGTARAERHLLPCQMKGRRVCWASHTLHRGRN